MVKNIFAEKHGEKHEVSLSELLAVQDLQPLAKGDDKTPGLSLGE